MDVAIRLPDLGRILHEDQAEGRERRATQLGKTFRLVLAAAHFLRALRKGWPRTLVVNRPGASQRRDRLLTGIPTKPGDDRDEYPPAEGRGRGPGLTRGADPLGWKADVEYVGSHENRSHGSVLGSKLRRFCDGTKFRYVFY